MAWSETFKLNKQLVRTLTACGYNNPTEVQLKTLKRIIGGQDVIVTGAIGCGKTTTYIISVLNRLNYAPDGVPKVLILLPDKEGVLSVIEQFEKLNKNEAVSIVGLYAAPGTESQMNALADGADIVVATPDRARAIYLKLGLNLNKMELFIVDDADLIVKQGLQLPVAELANSITKAQHLVFSSVMHPRIEKMIAPFMKFPTVIEVEQEPEIKIETFEQIAYHVPNFGTKLNLLSLFMQDEELFTKVVIFVNTRKTAEKVYKTIQRREKSLVGILNSPSIEYKNIKSVNEFIENNEVRALIVFEENLNAVELDQLPFIINFELPFNSSTFIDRVKLVDSPTDLLSISIITDLELDELKKIEVIIGKKIPIAQLPDDLIIETDKAKASTEAKLIKKSKSSIQVAGEAFHQKKPENSKTYNYSSGVKAKMNKKKKHG